MINLVEMEAEPRPENDNRFLNPSRYPTIRAVYDRFLEDYVATHQQHGDMSANVPMSEDTFRRKFKQCYPHVKIPKTNRFAQCDVCFLLRGKMELAPSKEKKKLYRKQLHLHQENVSKDKAVYYSHRSVASCQIALQFVGSLASCFANCPVDRNCFYLQVHVI
ncbi:hypothetical protein ABBQ32_001025 [Trebouxia sp. C0010 RCD-2024]